MTPESISELAPALVKAQGEFPIIAKGSENPFFQSKYADLADIIKAATPVLTKHGLAISQFVSSAVDGSTTLKTYLIHESGQSLSDEMPLLLPKDDPQGQGSAITYGRRYSYMAVLGLVADEDDDGNRASNKPAEHYVKPSGELVPAQEKASAKQVKYIEALMAQKGVANDADRALFLEAFFGAKSVGEVMNNVDTRNVINEVKSMAPSEVQKRIREPF